MPENETTGKTKTVRIWENNHTRAKAILKSEGYNLEGFVNKAVEEKLARLYVARETRS